MFSTGVGILFSNIFSSQSVDWEELLHLLVVTESQRGEVGWMGERERGNVEKKVLSGLPGALQVCEAVSWTSEHDMSSPMSFCLENKQTKKCCS